MYAAAHHAVYLAVKSGDLIRPETCSMCGNYFDYLEAHHDDYKKPLDVQWLCRRCHCSLHRPVRVRREIPIVDAGARIPENIHAKLKEYAERLGISQNAVIIMALNEYLGQKS